MLTVTESGQQCDGTSGKRGTPDGTENIFHKIRVTENGGKGRDSGGTKGVKSGFSDF